MFSDILLKAIAIVALLGGLIFVHELGHFLVAKAFRVKVLRFSIGFGPRIFGFTKGETEYRLALLPLGGYVKMAGEDPNDELAPEDRGRGFLEQKPWRRFFIAFAGPAFNLVFPVVIFFILGMSHNGKLIPGPRIHSLDVGLPAAEAGLKPGDKILSVQTPGEPAKQVRYFEDLKEWVSPRPGELITFVVERDGKTLPPITIKPAPQTATSPIETTTRGIIGVSPMHLPAIVAPLTDAKAAVETKRLELFDLVVQANGQPIAHYGDVAKAVEAARCGPMQLRVLREVVVPMPGAPLAVYRAVDLENVASCVEGKPAIAAADPRASTLIAAVAPGSPAEKAGLKPGDAIASINGERVRSISELNWLHIEPVVGKPIVLGLADGRTVSITPVDEAYFDELTQVTERRTVLGFFSEQRSERSGLVLMSALLTEQVRRSVGPRRAFTLAISNVSEVVRITVLGLARIFQGRISFKTVGGPIMLGQIVAKATEEGLERLVYIMALISVNLGLMNLFPIPVLDGGHIATCLVEGITRRPLSMRAREVANMVGLILLLTLMVFVIRNDIVRVLG